jgi:hypothetical protein
MLSEDKNRDSQGLSPEVTRPPAGRQQIQRPEGSSTPRFPAWDILPPHEIINPRLKRQK